MNTFESNTPPKDIFVCPKCRIAYYSPCSCSVGHEKVEAIHYVKAAPLKVVHLRSPRVKREKS